MKYTVGDLICGKNEGAGLGYITKITKDKLYADFIITIEWFINGRANDYRHTDLDGHISRREAFHYPVGKQ